VLVLRESLEIGYEVVSKVSLVAELSLQPVFQILKKLGTPRSKRCLTSLHLSTVIRLHFGDFEGDDSVINLFEVFLNLRLHLEPKKIGSGVEALEKERRKRKRKRHEEAREEKHFLAVRGTFRTRERTFCPPSPDFGRTRLNWRTLRALAVSDLSEIGSKWERKNCDFVGSNVSYTDLLAGSLGLDVERLFVSRGALFR